MKGIVFNLLEEVVRREHGESAWDEVLERSGVGGSYTSLSARPLPVIMVAGFGVLMDAAGEKPAAVDSVLPKPVTRAALREALAALAPTPAGRR